MSTQPTPVPDLRTFQDLAATLGRLYDRCPEATAAVLAAVYARLDALPGQTFVNQYDALASRYQQVLPDIAQNEALLPHLTTLAKELTQLLNPTPTPPPAPGTPTAESAVVTPSILVAIGIGLAAGTVVAIGIIGYCLSYPEKC